MVALYLRVIEEQGTMVPSSMDKLSQNKILSSIWHNYVCMARLRAPVDLQESFRKFFSWGSENMYYFVKISTANITNDTLFSFMNWQNMLVQFCQNLHCKYHRWLHVFLHELKKHVAWSNPFDQNYYCKYYMWQVAFLHELMKYVASRNIFHQN